MNNIKFILCLLVVVVFESGWIKSAPAADVIGTSRYATRLQSRLAVETESSTQIAEATTLSALLADRGNFIESEEDLEAFLRKTKEEMDRSIKANPANYANEDMSIEEIMSMFEDAIRRPTLEDEKERCAICLEDLDSEVVKRAYCGHEFHFKCLANYQRETENSRCPICRRSISYVHLNQH